MGSTMPPDPREYGPGPFKKPPPINAAVPAEPVNEPEPEETEE